VQAKAAYHLQLAVPRLRGKDRADRQAAHHLRQRLLVGALLGAEGDTAVAVVRRPDRALAGHTDALLAPDLASRTADLAACLGVVGAGAPVGKLGQQRLPDRSPVGLDPEYQVVGVDASDLLTRRVVYRQLHQDWPPFLPVLVTRTTPLTPPGT